MGLFVFLKATLALFFLSWEQFQLMLLLHGVEYCASMLAPSEWSSQSSQCSSNSTGICLFQISVNFSPPPPCTPSKCNLMHAHVWVFSFFLMYWRENQSYPLWLSSLYTEGSNNDWTALIHSQLHEESLHRPKKAHTNLSFSCLLSCSWLLLPALPVKREILFSGFSTFTLFIGSLSLLRIYIVACQRDIWASSGH